MMLASKLTLPSFADDGRFLHAQPVMAVGKVRIISDTVDSDFRKALLVEPPPAGRQIEHNGVTIAWLAPGEWLLTGTANAVRTVLDRVTRAVPDLSIALDITHGRACFEFGGTQARDAIAGVCGLDVRERSFAVGSVARTTLGATGMFIARLSDEGATPRFRLIVDQTMAAYAARMLRQPGQYRKAP